MTTTVIDSTSKPKINPAALMEYSREIIPMIKQLIYQKNLLKDFMESDATVVKMTDLIKESQEELKAFLAEDETASEISVKISDISNDIKSAVKAAARVCEYKPAELQQFFVARVKEAVGKTVEKGVVFSELEELLK